MTMEPNARANAYGTTDELRDRLAASLDFAQRTVECADPLHPMWKVDLGQVSGFDKMMMEAGLFALLVARTEYCQDAAWSLARAIRKNYDSGSAIACILRHPRLATSIGALLLVLERFGLATAREISVVHRALESPYLESSEHVPFRLLDRRWIWSLAQSEIRSLPEALHLSTACRTTHPIYMSRDDGYAITHAVMYATDFGARPAPAVLDGDALWKTIDAAVAWCLAAGDFDLLAELLLSQLFLRRRLSPYGVVAWRRSRRLWDSLGFLPSPSLSADAFVAFDEAEERRQYAFHNMYHTMLVGGLVALALLDQRVTPPEAPSRADPYEEPASVGRAIAEASRHLACALGIDSALAQAALAEMKWTGQDGDLDALSSDWTGEGFAEATVQAMANDAAIILAAQDYALPRLAEALRRAAVAGTATPTIQAGADFLARQFLAGGGVGAGMLAKEQEAAAGDGDLSTRVTSALANCLITVSTQLSGEVAA
nr:hypothetical protein [Sphingomonas lycopersici]